MRYISRYDEDSKKSALTALFILLFVFIFIVLFTFMVAIKTGSPEIIFMALICYFFVCVIIVSFALFQFIPANNRIKHKIYLKNNGIAIKARVLNVQNEKFFDTFPLVRVTPFDRSNKIHPRFRIVVGAYDRNNNRNQFFTSEWFNGTYAQDFQNALNFQGIEYLTIYLNPQNAFDYAFDAEEIAEIYRRSNMK